MNHQKIRAIAIYLPQYHPIPENDLWWGKGFTEWTNVVKARANFKDHYQPHLPADLGFYDLRLSEVREQQAALARKHGIHGFCYYHYWFNGKRLLEKPFTEVFNSGKPDFPFMLCWANENWTRKWDGGETEILLKQNYSAEDDRSHINTLIPYFKDSRYIKINGKPIIAIYRSTALPNVRSTLKIWREEALKHQIELYICRFESFSIAGKKYLEDGFDAAIDFQPWGKNMHDYKLMQLQKKQRTLGFRISNWWYRNITRKINEEAYKSFRENFKQKEMKSYVLSYEDYVNYVINAPQPDYKVFPCLTPMWDNTARYQKNPSLFYDSSPQLYKKWLTYILKSFQPYSTEENLIFINAWNEWAEGNHLEPCRKWGLSYLNVTKEVLEHE